MAERLNCQNCGNAGEIRAIYERQADPTKLDDSKVTGIYGHGRHVQKWVRIGSRCLVCGSFFPSKETEEARYRLLKYKKEWYKGIENFKAVIAIYKHTPHRYY